MTVIITVVNFLFSFLFRFVARELPESVWLRGLAVLAASMLSAVVIAVIVIATAPVMRQWLLTFRQRLRLENVNHPLLVRLASQAPGTYHHSLLVANLAAHAAKAIGADARLTRTAAYFHDVGKLAAPEYFVENQHGTNPHDTLDDPFKSTEIIKHHVAHGLELAKEYDLPKEIVDAIAQHHGTLVLRYFYDRAKEKGLSPHVSRFRYPGPRPISKEAALIMLADNAEAKVRSLPDKKPAAIRRAVAEAIAERHRERQLDLVGFTEDDYRRIAQAFTETFLVMHHQRLPQDKRVAETLRSRKI